MKRDNPNAFTDLILRIESMGKVTGKVGWFEDSTRYSDGMAVAEVAQMQEFGTKSIPARPFMRPAAIKNKNKWQETAKIVSERVAAGLMTAEQAMQVLASQAEGDVLQSITDVTSPALSPITIGVRKYKQMGKVVTGKTIGEIARKIQDGTLDTSGVSTKPLDDTGHMIATLTTHIENDK